MGAPLQLECNCDKSVIDKLETSSMAGLSFPFGLKKHN